MALCFEISEKMKVISQCWFAAQLQTSTFKRRKLGLFYLKFSAEFQSLKIRGRPKNT